MRGLRYPYGWMLAAALPSMAFAQAETTTFEYDAQGRLTKSSKAGGPAAGTVKTTSYDKAGNRTNYSVTGASGAAPRDAGALGSPDYVAPSDDPPVSEGAPLAEGAPGGGG